MRILWIAVGIAAAVVVAGCTSRTAGSNRSGSTSSAASGSATTSAPANSPSQPSQPSGPGLSTSGSAGSATSGSATTKQVVRPVDRNGRLSPGFSAVPESSSEPVVCDRHYASPVAVDPGILECGDSALYGVACWPAASAGTVLCDRDPFGRQLAQIPARFVTKLPVTHEPAVPFGLALDNGEQCKVRDGGAWSKPEQQPSYVGYYLCGSENAVWGPPDDYRTGGINQSSPQWTVVVGSSSGKGPLVRHHVVTAVFVGMAG